MKTKPTHTPTPWKVMSDDREINNDKGVMICELYSGDKKPQWFLPTLEERKANAAFIVRAVNSHEALLKSLKYIVDGIDRQNGFIPDDIRKAIAQAEGGL